MPPSWKKLELLHHKLAVLERQGVSIAKDASILDFGCGAGTLVIEAVSDGFVTCRGFDIVDYLSDEARTRPSLFAFDEFGRLPYADNSIDLVVSDEVFEHVQDQGKSFSEIFRVLRPGGYAVHSIPARYQIIEPHIYVPFGGLIGVRWYFKLWALLGVRCGSQQGMSADQVAWNNAASFVLNLRYIGNSNYRALWRFIGYGVRYSELEYMATSRKQSTRALGKLARLFPPVLWAIRTCWQRVVVMQKPLVQPSGGGRSGTRHGS